jgi:hypothetical protein
MQERLFEFAGEAKRRQDMIRFGHFLDARQFKGAREAYPRAVPGSGDADSEQLEADAEPGLLTLLGRVAPPRDMGYLIGGGAVLPSPSGLDGGPGPEVSRGQSP